jgi:hypothetical protein
MSETQLVTRLLEELTRQARPALPISIDLWDINLIAEYLKRKPEHVRERIICLPNFPKAIRLPSAKGRAHPLYKATEVIAWSESHRERR